MKGIKLTEDINYLHCEDENGGHGIMTLMGNGRPVRVAEINDQSDFRFWFNAFTKAVSDRKTFVGAR